MTIQIQILNDLQHDLFFRDQFVQKAICRDFTSIGGLSAAEYLTCFQLVYSGLYNVRVVITPAECLQEAICWFLSGRGHMNQQPVA